MERLKEASSMAGVSAIFMAVPELFASGGKSPAAWGSVIAGLFAIFRRESQAAK